MQQWFLLVGALLVAMAFGNTVVRRLPLSPAMLYLVVGLAIGPGGARWIEIDLFSNASVVELLAEIAVLVTLFSVGMRLRLPTRWGTWWLPLRLATLGMVLTTLLAAVVAVWVLDLPWPAALLLAAILAPTDPVLASELQIRNPGDRDAVRLTLTAEGGLNDGAAFPALMLALGLLGAHPLGVAWSRWLLVDLLWATTGGLVIGWLGGSAVAALIRRLQRAGRPIEQVEFLVLGLIGLLYGGALALQTYGFLAVFAGGLALGRSFQRDDGRNDSGTTPPTSLRSGVVAWTAQSERLCEVALVLVVGALLGHTTPSTPTMIYAALLIFAVRPLAVLLSAPGRISVQQRRLISWFGIRGIGSLYYLAFALDHGLPTSVTRVVADAALIAISVSIALHGISATPLMDWYERRRA